MKFWFVTLFFVLCFNGSSQIPKGFVDVKHMIPDLDVELKYLGSDNFVGKPIDGYLKHKLYVTEETAKALKKVHLELQSQNLCLKIYDGYRPQRAVNHFVKWAEQLNDTINKNRYYPNVKKQELFKFDYIAFKSGHSRGSTVDVTIIDGNTGTPLDMGSQFDFFDKASWVDYQGISKQQSANRKLLQRVMLKHGFKHYPKEWWHFTLKNEPFPNTYFDFLVE